MNKTLIIAGVVALVLGLILGSVTVTQSHLWGAYQTSSTPYVAFMIPLAIGGIVMIVVGLTLKK